MCVPLFVLFLQAVLLLSGSLVTGVERIQLSSDPDCVSWGLRRVDCFARATDNATWHTFCIFLQYCSNKDWVPWESLGGIANSGPTAASWAIDHLDVFALGQDSELWQNSWAGTGWNGWVNSPAQGIVLTSDPDCTSWGPNRIDCFSRGLDSIWHVSWNGASWSTWSSLGGVATSGPTATSRAVNTLDVFARGPDNALWQDAWDGNTWNGWTRVDMGAVPDGMITSDPDCVTGAVSPDRIDCFARGTDNSTWHTYLGWGMWEALGGTLTAGPSVASAEVGTMDVMARGQNNTLLHIRWVDGTGWSNWESVPMLATTSTSTATTTGSTTTSSSQSSTTVIPEFPLKKDLVTLLSLVAVASFIALARRSQDNE